MGRLDVGIDRFQLAQGLLMSLEHVAITLDTAHDAESFVAALEMNESTWREIERFLPLLGWDVPTETLAFSLSVSSRARRGVNDQTVDALIAINRRLISRIGEMPERSGLRRRVQSGDFRQKVIGDEGLHQGA